MKFTFATPILLTVSPGVEVPAAEVTLDGVRLELDEGKFAVLLSDDAKNRKGIVGNLTPETLASVKRDVEAAIVAQCGPAADDHAMMVETMHKPSTGYNPELAVQLGTFFDAITEAK